jgi:hypothetical protein
MDQHAWKEKGKCKDFDTNFFFDKYEEDKDLRLAVDNLCSTCPMAKHCFAVGVSQKEWGVWGGIYLENGKISKEYNKHRTKEDWAKTWTYLTMDK